jgi:hypothetical protein
MRGGENLEGVDENPGSGAGASGAYRLVGEVTRAPKIAGAELRARGLYG